MKMLEKHPLGAFASAFYIFSCVFFSIGGGVRITASIIALAVFVSVMLCLKILGKYGIGRAACALSAAFLAASLFSVITVDIGIARAEAESRDGVQLRGTVRAVVHSTTYSGCYRVEPKNGVFNCSSSVLLYCDNGEIAVGDEVRCEADVLPLDKRDGNDYHYADGVFLTAESVTEVEICGKSDDIETRLSLFRESLSSRFTSEMSEETGGFATALVLGDKSNLPGSVSRDFRSLGISHILALSGTHLTVIFAAVSRLIPNRGKLRYARALVMVFGVLFYMGLTGFPSSVVRSGIMFIISAAADLFNKKSDSFTSLSVAVFIICLFNPYAPFDMGLQLSFVSVLGLIMSDRIDKRFAQSGKRPRKLLSKVIPALVVPAVVLPLSWLRFGGVSLMSPVANLILVPVITLLIPLLALSLVLSYIPAIFTSVATVLEVVIDLVLDVVRGMAEITDSVLPLKGDAVAVFVILFAVLLIGALLAFGKWRKVSGCLAVAMLFCSVLTAQIYELYRSGGTTVYYSASGSNDAVAVVSDGYTVLVDVGRFSSAMLDASDVSVGYSGHVDSVVLSHLHRDHASVISDLAERFYLETLWIPMPYSENTALIYNGIVSEAVRLGVEVRSYVSGEIFSVGECIFSSPSIEWIKGSDHPSVSFSFEVDGKGIMYIGTRTDEPVPDGWARIVGSHCHKGKGVLEGDDLTVMSPKCAESFDAVDGVVTVTDGAVIRLGETVTAEHYEG